MVKERRGVPRRALNAVLCCAGAPSASSLPTFRVPQAPTLHPLCTMRLHHRLSRHTRNPMLFNP